MYTEKQKLSRKHDEGGSVSAVRSSSLHSQVYDQRHDEDDETQDDDQD